MEIILFVLVSLFSFSLSSDVKSEVLKISFAESIINTQRNSFLLTETSENCLSTLEKGIERQKCGICGTTDYISNEEKTSAFNCEEEANQYVEYFKDTLPGGASISQMKVTLSGSFCGELILGVNDMTIGQSKGEGKCVCENSTIDQCLPSSSIILESSEIDFDTQYFYGVSNKLWIKVLSGTVKLTTASIEYFYTLPSDNNIQRSSSCPKIIPIDSKQNFSCSVSSKEKNAPKRCFNLDSLFTNWESINLNKMKVQVLQCSNKQRSFCTAVKSKDFHVDLTGSIPQICISSYSCAGVTNNQPCFRYYDVVATAAECQNAVFSLSIINQKADNTDNSKCSQQTIEIKLTSVEAQNVDGNSVDSSFSGTYGFSFKVTKKVAVTHLGIFCSPYNPVKNLVSFAGIWETSSGALLTSKSITLTCTTEGYLYSPVSKLIFLSPGKTYSFGAMKNPGGSSNGMRAPYSSNSVFNPLLSDVVTKAENKFIVNKLSMPVDAISTSEKPGNFKLAQY